MTRSMDDLLYLAIGIGLFAVSALLLRGRRGARTAAGDASSAADAPAGPAPAGEAIS